MAQRGLLTPHPGQHGCSTLCPQFIGNLAETPVFAPSLQTRWCPWRLSLAFPWQPSRLCCTRKITSMFFRYRGEAGLGSKRNLQGLWGLEPFLLRRCLRSSQLPGQCFPHQQIVEVRLPEGSDLKERALLISLATCLGERKGRRNSSS